MTNIDPPATWFLIYAHRGEIQEVPNIVRHTRTKAVDLGGCQYSTREIFPTPGEAARALQAEVAYVLNEARRYLETAKYEVEELEELAAKVARDYHS